MAGTSPPKAGAVVVNRLGGQVGSSQEPRSLRLLYCPFPAGDVSVGDMGRGPPVRCQSHPLSEILNA